MKKFLIIISCLFSFLINSNVYANEDVAKEILPYYIWIDDENIEMIGKVYDTSGRLYFSKSGNSYSVGNMFDFHSDFSSSNCKISQDELKLFKTIVYFGYLENPTDENYFLTQMLIWEKISNLFYGVDSTVREMVPQYDEKITKIWNQVEKHLQNEQIKSNLWNTYNFDYKNIELINNKTGLKLEYQENGLQVYNEKIGNYEFNIHYPDENILCLAGFGINDTVYWHSEGGPAFSIKKIEYNVSGVQVNIEEKIHGVGDFLGDSQNETKYELYLDNKLILETNTNQFFVAPNKTYTLKVMNSEGYLKNESITLNVKDTELNQVIDKYVISKTYNLDIQDNNEYQIYLKRTGELVANVNVNTNTIVLPYGEYIIKKDNEIIKEIKVEDNRDEFLQIGVVKKPEENVPNQNDYADLRVENPQTGKNLSYLNIFLGLLLLLLLLVKVYFKKVKKCK